MKPSSGLSRPECCFSDDTGSMRRAPGPWPVGFSKKAWNNSCSPPGSSNRHTVHHYAGGRFFGWYPAVGTGHSENTMGIDCAEPAKQSILHSKHNIIYLVE
jgi:hypothetical protein